ncbi:metallothionein 20-III-like isoform X1 [Homalodisca vitripennis]|uniref:metallothionein 20-III-like isoform X1 n=1 Tax=Homalodisca vitripennis TaxID=197043 RepID=UPI001EECEDBB|nr:metallothionein 20-III-like isoform X1 [Homalodisca vitripennis]
MQLLHTTRLSSVAMPGPCCGSGGKCQGSACNCGAACNCGSDCPCSASKPHTQDSQSNVGDKK